MTPNSRNTRIAALSLAVVAIALMVVAIAVILAVRPTGVPVVQAAAGGESATPAAVTSGLITPQQYTAQYVDGGAAHQLVDVRTPEEFASGHLPDAINIPLQELSGRLGEIAANEPVVLYCRSGNRSGQAAQLLAGAGYTQILDLGGIIAWEAAGLPVVQ